MILSSFSALTAVEAKAATDKITLELNDTNIKWAKTVTFYELLARKTIPIGMDRCGIHCVLMFLPTR
jgi:hypothetical protein